METTLQPHAHIQAMEKRWEATFIETFTVNASFFFSLSDYHSLFVQSSLVRMDFCAKIRAMVVSI